MRVIAGHEHGTEDPSLSLGMTNALGMTLSGES